MKKLVALILSVVMVLSMTMAASAAFVASPSANAAPSLEDVIVEGVAEGEDDGLTIKITAYKDRDDLKDESKKAIEDSYKEIKNSNGIVNLVPALKEIAKKANVKESDLAVSDLFDISVTEGKLDQKITLVIGAETLKNFVALLHNKDGKWNVVEGVKIDGDKLTFSVNSLSPFAIVVNNAEDKDSPATANTVDLGMILVVCASVFGAAAIFCIAKAKKTVND